MKALRSGSTERGGLGIVRAAFEKIEFAFREQPVDFGIDATAELLVDDEATGRWISIQIKSGESYLSEIAANGEFVFRVDDAHVNYWREHMLPVIVCLCDVEKQVVYWQEVSESTLISTGTAWKILVPQSQTIDLCRTELIERATPVVATERCTVIGPDDVSHGGAKRYRFDVILNGTATRSEVASIVRQVTAFGIKRRYNRSKTAERRWGDSAAHVVWVFVAPSAVDQARGNYVCSSEWIDADLEPEARPVRREGVDIGNGIVLRWNDAYAHVGLVLKEATVNKEVFVVLADSTLSELRRGLDEFGHSWDESVRTGFDETLDVFAEADARFRSVVAPFECERLSQVLDGLISHVSNLVLYFRTPEFQKRSPEDRRFLVNTSLAAARSAAAKVSYELEIVR